MITIERPGGSRLRQQASWPYWLRGKRSIVLDLKDQADQAVARSLTAGADVVVEAWGPRVADRLGLGDETLRGANPGLVYTAISGFGHDGPYSHLKAYEAVVMAKTGSMYGNTAPHRPGPVMINPLGAMASAALLAMQGTLIAAPRARRLGLWTEGRCHHGAGDDGAGSLVLLSARADPEVP